MGRGGDKMKKGEIDDQVFTSFIVHFLSLKFVIFFNYFYERINIYVF